MKILFLTGSLNQGGAEYQLLELAKLFNDRGHHIEVFAITDYDFYKPFIESNNIIYNHLYNNQSKLKRVFLTAKKFRSFKPELIISYIRSVSQVALFAKLLSGITSKLIIGERTSLVLPRHDKYYFNLMRIADAVTVNSISKLKYLNENFTKLKKKTFFFPNIIDIEKFGFIQKKYESKNIKLGFVGRISPEKNVINLIKAIKILINKNIEVELSIYGDARNIDYSNQVNSLIKDNTLEDIVIFKGKSNTIKEVYKEIDLLCLISDYEGFSNVIAEGMCCGLPVVTSDIPENKYLIVNEVNGFVVNHKAPEEIAEGINSYIKISKELKMKMAMTNRAKAVEIFDKEKIYSQYIELIQSF